MLRTDNGRKENGQSESSKLYASAAVPMRRNSLSSTTTKSCLLRPPCMHHAVRYHAQQCLYVSSFETWGVDFHQLSEDSCSLPLNRPATHGFLPSARRKRVLLRLRLANALFRPALIKPRRHSTTGATLPENNEASAKLTTTNGGTFTSSSGRLIFSSQSCYSTLDQRLTCFNVIGYCDWLNSK